MPYHDYGNTHIFLGPLSLKLAQLVIHADHADQMWHGAFQVEREELAGELQEAREDLRHSVGDQDGDGGGAGDDGGGGGGGGSGFWLIPEDTR